MNGGRMETGSSNTTTSANEQRKRKDGPVDDAPRIKRQRVSRACDQCRAGREKCDGIKPICGTCASLERPCTYDTAAKKRGIQPGYIRTLELSLAWLFSRDPAAESMFKTELAIENSPVQKLLSSKEGSDSDLLHSRWSKGTINKQIDQLLSGVQVSPPSQLSPAFAAEDSDGFVKDLFQPQTKSRDANARPEVRGRASFAAPVPLTPGMPLAPLSDVAQAQTDDRLCLPSDFWRLLDVYYTFIHSWLPISEKNDMLKSAYSYPMEGLRVLATDPGSGNHAELWAILSLAAHQISPRKQQDEIDVCMATAKKLLPEESGPFELGHVRANILLSLIYIGREDRTPAWMLIGRAIRIAYDLRLHEQAVNQMPRGKHVMLACYLVEAVLGRLYSMPCHLKGQGYNNSNQLEEDGLEEWNPWDGGGNVSSQQMHGLARKPAQTLSMFNKLLRALRDNESGAATPVEQQHANKLQLARQSSTNSVGFEMGATQTQNVDSMDINGYPTELDPWSPQQLHYEVITLWLMCERSPLAGRQAWVSFTKRLQAYIQCFGASRVPPTAVPLLSKLLHAQSPDSQTMSLRNTIASLPHIWRQETPIQAIAFQTTPGQDASPASFSGEPWVPLRRQSLENNPTTRQHAHISASSPQIRGNLVVSPDQYRSFPAMQDPVASSRTQNHLPPLQNVVSPGGTTGFAMPQLSRQSMPASGQPMTYPSHEQNNTVDLESIFEEIAVLDGTRSDGARPEFMRNLGLGPDLDLSAFFGADYQPSDPLFSYFQPGLYGNDGNHSNAFPPG